MQKRNKLKRRFAFILTPGFIFIIFLAFHVNAYSQEHTEKALYITLQKNFSNKNPYEQVISGTTLKRAGIHNLAQALALYSGIQILNSNGSNQNFAVSIRGFGSNAAQNSLILLDDVPLSHIDLATPEISMLPIQDIDHIVIIWGSEGVRYGDQAVGGIVAIYTKKISKNHLYSQITTGNPLQNRLYFHTSQSLPHWRIYQSGEIFSQQTGRNHSRDDTGRAFGQATYDNLTSQLGISYLYSHEYQLFPGALTLEQVARNRHGSQNEDDYERSKLLWLHLHEQTLINPHWDLKNNAALRLQKNDVYLMSSLSQQRENFWLQPEIIGHWLRFKIHLAQAFQIDSYHLNDQWGNTEADAIQWSPFTLANFNLTKKLQIESGVRYASLFQNIAPSPLLLQKHQGIWVNTSAINYHFSQHWLGFIRRDTNYRFPKIDEELFTSAEDSLKTQQGISYETGIQYFTNKLTSSLEIYQLDLTNEIAFDPTQNAEQPFGANRNLDPTRRQGMQLQNQWRLTPSLQLNSGWTYTHAYFRNGDYAGNSIPFVAKNIFSVVLDKHWLSNWDTGIEMRYLSKRYFINDNRNFSSIPPMSIMNTFISYHQKKWQLNFRINNLANHHYNDYAVWQNSLSTAYYYPAIGRNYLFSLVIYN